jgi:hypothetical protein
MQRYPARFEPVARVMKCKAGECGLNLRILKDEDAGGFYLHFQGRRPTDQEREWIGTETMKAVDRAPKAD